MTVAALTELFLLNMGYARSDLAEEDVVEEYSGVLLRWLNEGYRRALRRLGGRAEANRASALCGQEDEPVLLEKELHPLLADYAAARAQELRGNGVTASALYAAFERGLSDAAEGRCAGLGAWSDL